MSDTTRGDGFYNAINMMLPSNAYVLIDNMRFTLEDLRGIVRTNQEQREASNRALTDRFVDFQNHVHSAIAELVEDGDLDRSVANEVLDGLGLERVPTEYQVEVTVYTTLLVTSSLGEDDLRAVIEDVAIEFSSSSSDYDLDDERDRNVEVTSVSEG
jgi:hypothetical protein